MVNYYELLGVDKTASESEIQKAYKRAALKNHPDKGGDEEIFKQINQAKEILTDHVKRRIYDTYGEEGVNNSDNNNFMTKGEDMVHQVSVKLDELYSGKPLKFNLTRNIICTTCNGNGCKLEYLKVCNNCNGQKFQIQTIHLGPGMSQQMQIPCNRCNATGTLVDPLHRCNLCNGQRIIVDKTKMELFITKGMQNNQHLTVQGGGNEYPGTIPGNLVIVINEVPHKQFIRDGNDLVLIQPIQLVDALCGFKFYITHLDGRILQICTRPSEIITPTSLKCILGEGMPIFNAGGSGSSDKGNLKIKFDIKFPKDGFFNNDVINNIKDILPKSELSNNSNSNSIKCYLSNYEESQNNEKRFKASGGPQVQQCAQQ